MDEPITAPAPATADAGTGSWLAAEPVVERVQLDDRSWIDVVRGFLPAADALHDELRDTVDWKQGSVYRYERAIDEPRLNGWHAGAQRHPALVEVQQWISRRYRVMFDGYALALYRHERDSVAWHRDREMKWLEETLIGVLSLGQQRPFLVKPNVGVRNDLVDDTMGAIDLSPASGDLLLMGGRCQSDWLHTVPKVRERVRTRISVQYRWTSKRGKPDLAPGYAAPRTFSRR